MLSESDKNKLEFLEKQNIKYFTKILNIEKLNKKLLFENGILQSEIDELKYLLLEKDKEITKLKNREVEIELTKEEKRKNLKKVQKEIIYIEQAKHISNLSKKNIELRKKLYVVRNELVYLKLNYKDNND